MTARRIVALFGWLRWRTLRGAIATKGALRWTVLMGLVASFVFGSAAAIGFAIAGHRVDDPRSLFTIATTMLAIIVVAIGVIAGVSQPIDPRVLATEPIHDRHLALGLLVGSATGPPGLSALLVAIGLFIGSVGGLGAVVPAGLAAFALLLTLLLVSRTTINLLGLFTTRTPRAGQIMIGLVSIVFYGGFQLVPRILFDLDDDQRANLAKLLQWSPPGQIGAAFGQADDAPFEAIARVGLGVLWLPLLAWLFTISTRRLIVATKIDGGAAAPSTGDAERRRNPISRLAEWASGTGPAGAVAWRSVKTRLRNPRSALETFIASGVGMAVVLVPAIFRDDAGAGAVLVGGAVQIAVLFMAGNCFGSDGPALSNELLCGVDPEVLVRGKARSVMICAAPVAILGPLIATAITAEWAYLPAGFLVAGGGLLAGAGAAMVQSIHAPIAIPEGDNPLASGDTGKGCLAGLILAAILIGLALATLPIALGLFWAIDRRSWFAVTVLAILTFAAGRGILVVAVRHTASAWRRREPELYEAVIPAR